MEPNVEEFREDLAAARREFQNGRPSEAINRVVSARWAWRYAKDPERFQLLKEMYASVESPMTEESCRRNPWQLKLLFELYSVWPKLHLEEAILKHSFPEPPSDDYVVSGAESVQLVELSLGFSIGPGRPVALSRGRHWLKLWDVEIGDVIHAREESLELLASAIGRDSSHVLFAQSWRAPETTESRWSTSFRETLRRISSSRWTHAKSDSTQTRYYKVSGEVVSVDRERTIEVDRKIFEENPVKGEVLPPRKFKPETKRSLEYLREVYSEEEVQEILQNVEREKQHQREIVRVRQPQMLTLAHEAIEGFLPAGTTTFIAEDGFTEPKISDLWSGVGRITATVAVIGDEAWLENIIVPGHGLKGMYGIPATTPITAVCISSDGALGLRNGNGETFGIWNLWTGDCLREFVGHTDRVTCLDLSVDVSFAVSGSEDKTVRLWKPVTAECVRVFEGHEAVITKVCISLDATKILSADRGGVIKLWDLKSGECLRTIPAHSQSVSGLHLTFDSKFAVSGSWDKTVKLWNLSDGSCIRSFEHDDWVTSVDMTPDGRYLVSSSYAGTKVWELIWRMEPRDVAEWDEGARPYVEILLNANSAWDGKLSTSVDMTEEEKKNTLRRQGPTWTAWHAPSKKEDWYRVWHLNWDIYETLGNAGYGWVSGAGDVHKKLGEEYGARRDAARAADSTSE
jgi:WD40 repeat protein